MDFFSGDFTNRNAREEVNHLGGPIAECRVPLDFLLHECMCVVLLGENFCGGTPKIAEHIGWPFGFGPPVDQHIFHLWRFLIFFKIRF
jgi:hypothetical protein